MFRARATRVRTYLETPNEEGTRELSLIWRQNKLFTLYLFQIRSLCVRMRGVRRNAGCEVLLLNSCFISDRELVYEDVGRDEDGVRKRNSIITLV